MTTTTQFSIPVVVKEVKQHTPLIKGFIFERRNGEAFSPISGGSHVVVSMGEGSDSHKNPYSLVRVSDDYMQYEIAVRREANGRGGSAFMHDNVEVGTELEIGNPYNLFPIYKLARKHLFIAGGVGITPFIAFIKEMQMMDWPFEMHYAFRSKEHAAFADEMKEKCPDELHVYNHNEDQLLDFNKLLAKQPLGTHVYVCGPHRMVGDVLRIAEELGWPEVAVHSEEFKAPDPGNPFTVKLARSHREINVSERESLLEALEHANVEIPYSCRGGACGFCKTDVLEGTPDHRDFYLTDDEKAENNCIMPCISRAKDDVLVLDL